MLPGNHPNHAGRGPAASGGTMNRIPHTLGMASIALMGLSLTAEDFQPLMKAARTTWPEKQHIGVICDFRTSKAEVMALAAAAGEGAHITVADTRVMEQAGAAAALLSAQRTDYVVLLPRDRNFRDGSFGATVAVNRLASRGVPAVGTYPSAVKQGAVFSLGEGTQGQLLVTDRLIGTVDVILPTQAALVEKAALVIQEKGKATVAVHLAQ